MRYILIILIFFYSLVGCSHLNSKTQPSILQLIEAEDNAVAASVATTVERRIFLVNLHGEMKGRFCAEPPPDAAENIASTFSSAINASASGKVDPQIAASLASSLSTSMQAMTKRSQGIILYRDGMFNLCQAYLNNVIKEDEYVARSKDLLAQSVKLVELELTKSDGRVGPAALPSISQVPESGSLAAVAGAAASTAAQQATSQAIADNKTPAQAGAEAQKAATAAVSAAAATLQVNGTQAAAVSKAIETVTEIVDASTSKNVE